MENKDKKSLDKYFDLAKKEKVEYSKEDTKKLLVRYATTGSVGLLSSWWIKSLFNLKFMSFAAATVISSFAVYYSFFHNKNIDNNPKSKANYPVSSVISNDTISVSKNEKSKNKADSIVNKSRKADIIKDNELVTMKNSIKSDFAKADKHNDKVDIPNNEKIENTDINKEKSYDDTKQGDSYAYYGIGKSRDQGFASNFNMNFNPSNSNLSNPFSPAYIEFPTNEFKTIINDFALKNAYSVTGACKYSKVFGNNSILVGGKILWTMNDRISIGFSGYGNTSSGFYTYTMTDNKNQQSTGKFNYGYGAVTIEYIFNPNNAVILGLTGNIGIGSYKMVIPSDNGLNNSTTTASIPWASFWVLEPGINIEVPVFKYVRIGAEATYRFTKVFQSERKFSDYPELRSLDKNSIAAGLFLKIGLF